jgi:hypothetical protein
MNPEWEVRVIDVEGEFLQGKFQNGEEMCMEVPDGMEQYYGSCKVVVLRMLVPIFGTKQAAECFYKELVKRPRRKVMSAQMLTSHCSNYGPRRVFIRFCRLGRQYHYIIAFGAKADLDALEADITTSFEAKAEPVFNKYVGNKIEINRGDDGIATIKFTQPHTPIMSCAPMTPAVPGSNLCKGEGTNLIILEQATRYRSLVALILYIICNGAGLTYTMLVVVSLGTCTLQMSHIGKHYTTVLHTSWGPVIEA